MNRSLRSTRRLVALSGRAWDGFEPLEPRKLLATFVVDTASDSSTFNDGVTSLREAIELSNLTEVVDDIVFDQSLIGQTITLTQGQLQVTNSAVIQGLGAELTEISGGNSSRVFDINLPFGGSVVITDLAVRNGFVAGDENGGGVRVAQNAVAVLERVGIRNNEAEKWGGGVFVEASGRLVMRNSYVTDNRASFGGGVGVNESGARATLDGVTVSGNSAGLNGAGVLVRDGAGPVLIRGSTITANTVLGSSGGGGIAAEGRLPNLTLISSIVAGNFGSAGGSMGEITNFDGLDIAGSMNNVIGASFGGFADGENGNIVTDDPGLLPIGFYGGQIRVHALAEDSVAIDAGVNPAGTARDGRDLRFFTRVFGDAADAGAFERQSATFRVDINVAEESGPSLAEGDLTLYEAAFLSNANPGSDFIRFTGDLDRIELRNGEIGLSDSVRIVGPGADKLLISANGLSRHFFVDNFNGSTEIDVAIIGLTLSSGRATGGADGGSIGTRENLLLDRVVFSSNQAVGADAHGGAIDVFGGGSLTIFDSLFQFNSADGDSGAIHLRSGRSSVIVGTTFSRNTAAESGGAIGVFAGSLSIESSTIAENRADGARQGNKFGGGLMILLPPASGSVSLLNTIFADNYLGFQFDGNFDDIRNAAGLNMGLSRNNLIETAGVQAGGVTNGDNGNLVGIESGLLGLGEYGGPMRTHALRADSPAVDAGLFEGDPATTGADARGGVFKRLFGDAVDIGAVEYQLFDLTVDNAGDVSNGDLSVGDVTLREVLEIVSVNPGVETVRFSAALNGQTITLDGAELGVGPDTIIEGPGADRLTIDAQGLSRVFRVLGTGIEENSETIIRGLAITGGLADVGDGGAGIRSSVQRLVLEGVHIYGNRLEETPDSDIGNQRGGAGLYVGGNRDVVIRNSTFNDNEGDGYGGAAYLNGMFEIESSTFANNRAKEEGGAIFVGYEGEGSVRNSTFFRNEADTDSTGDELGGAIFASGQFSSRPPGSIVISSTIFASDTAAGSPNTLEFEQRGAINFNESRNNLFSNAGSSDSLVNGFNGNLVSFNPRLGTLDFHAGSPTPVLNLLPESPAINAGDNPLDLATDQRGLPRLAAGAPDIGAFEYRPVVLADVDISVDRFFRSEGVRLTSSIQLRDGLVGAVVYYLDANGNGVAEAEERIGDASAGPDFAFTFIPSSGVSAGGLEFLAVVRDASGLTGLPLKLSAELEDDLPTRAKIASVGLSTSEFSQGDSVTITADLEAGDLAAGSVRFYVDSDGDGAFDPAIDRLLGEDTDGSDGFAITLSGAQTAQLGVGLNNILAVATDGSENAEPVLATASVLYSLRAGDNNVVRGVADRADNHRLVTVNEAGDVLAFEQEGWNAVNLTDSLGAPKAIGDALTWIDPKADGLYAAYPSADGLILLARSAEGVWSFRNLDTELGLDASQVVNQITQFTSAEATGQVVVIAGKTADGALFVYRQTGGVNSDGFEYAHIDLNAEAERGGFAIPQLTELISYRPSWDAWHLAGLDENGDIISVWQPPGTTSWRVDNLSTITGAQPLIGGLSVILTSWNGITLTGLDAGGSVISSWWVPQFGGDWRQLDLTAAFDGPALSNAALTSFYTSWNAQNYAGVNEQGEVVVYWWVPQFGGAWRVSTLTEAADDSTRITSALNAHASTASTLNVFGAAADGSVVRASWQPGDGLWSLENLTETAERV